MKKENKESRLSDVLLQAYSLDNSQVSVRRGFSLIESLVAIFIFSLAAAMLAGTFSSFFKTYASAKKSQRSTESAQYVMNMMAKTIRNSTLKSDPSVVDNLVMFDNSRSECVAYWYDAGKLQVATQSGASFVSADDCDVYTSSNLSYSDLTNAGEISGVLFIGVKSDKIAMKVGKVLISVRVSGGDSSQIQTTVSLRDEKYVAPLPTYVCTVIPNNAKMCANDDTGLTGDEISTVVASVAACTAPQKCEYVCDAGYVKAGNTCVALDSTPPSIPTNLVATAVSSSQINLSWTASTDNSGVIAGYEIYKDATLLYKTSGSGTTYSSSGLNPGVSYAYYVKAYDDAENVSGNSLTKSATTLAACSTALAPQFTGTCGSGKSVSLSNGCTYIIMDNQGNGIGKDWKQYEYICENGVWKDTVMGNPVDGDVGYLPKENVWSDNCGNTSSKNTTC